MRHCLPLVLLLVLDSSGWASDVDAPKLPASAQAVLDAAEKDVLRNLTAYGDANRKSLDKAMAALKAEIKKATQAGDLQTANALNAKLDDMAKGQFVADIEEAKKKGGLLGDKPTDEHMFLGQWKINHAGAKDFMIWTVGAKGVITRPGMTGAWRVAGANSIEIAWKPDQWTDTLDIQAGSMHTDVGDATFEASRFETKKK